MGAALVKFPQIFNIVKAQSGKGILASMFYMECFMHIINGCYNIHLKSPFSVYGENFCLLAQNLILIILLWTYGNNSTMKQKIIISLVIFTSFLYLYLDLFCPAYFWSLLMNVQIFMVIYSRMPQILENYKTKYTGELSSIMFLLNTLGNLARTFTFIKETHDLLNMFTSGLSAILNFTIFIQVFIYWKNKNPAEPVKPIKSLNDLIPVPDPVFEEKNLV
mmetsp:Transcript_5580/g.4782  ORF Transcript_5580/g.4782 Transcript_5580/m.4782 type:complete len:220 (+) Transcript_5580:218-877(+)